jgi:hypothetical protein
LKIVLRACAYPLMPAHLAIFLRDEAGSGMSLDDWKEADKPYHDVAMEALAIDVHDSRDFQAAIASKVYGPTNKALSKLSPRNQFKALAPRLMFATVMTKPDGTIHRPHGDDVSAVLIPKGQRPIEATWIEGLLGELMKRPFVMGYDLLEPLETLRAAGGDEFNPTKLKGFVEQHVGSACVFSYEP